MELSQVIVVQLGVEQRSEILECLRTTGEDRYTLKVAATSMPHLERVVNELTAFGSTTTTSLTASEQPSAVRRDR